MTVASSLSYVIRDFEASARKESGRFVSLYIIFKMTIKRNTAQDIVTLMQIYREGREIMLSCGNVNQWRQGYPTEEIILEDISKGQSYGIWDNDQLVGSFAFIKGKDPTYAYIENGAWLEDTKPYATIHRLASLKASKGIAEACFDWSWGQIQNLRVDTHRDNVIMRHCVEKAGFKYCGIIYLETGDSRLAYQKIEDYSAAIKANIQ